MKRLAAVILFLTLALPCVAAQTSEIRYRIMSCSPYLIHVSFPDGAPEVNDFDFAKAIRTIRGDWSMTLDTERVVLAKNPKSKSVIDLAGFKTLLNKLLTTKSQKVVELPPLEDCPPSPPLSATAGKTDKPGQPVQQTPPAESAQPSQPVTEVTGKAAAK